MKLLYFFFHLIYRFLSITGQIIWWIYCLPFRLLDLLLPFPKHSLFSSDEITGYEFEVFCTRWLKKHGYRHCQVTRASGDQGVDILATKGRHHYAIQCKYYSDKVGNKAVQEVYAGMIFHNCDRAVVMTNSEFTPAAIALADKTDVLLIEHVRYQPPASVRVNCMAVSFLMLAGITALLSWYIGLH